MSPPDVASAPAPRHLIVLVHGIWGFDWQVGTGRGVAIARLRRRCRAARIAPLRSAWRDPPPRATLCKLPCQLRAHINARHALQTRGSLQKRNLI